MEEIQVGEKIQIVEEEGKRYFVIWGSNPLIKKSLNVNRNINVRFEGDTTVYTLVGGHTGLVIRNDPEWEATQCSFSELFVPGKCFEILN